MSMEKGGRKTPWYADLRYEGRVSKTQRKVSSHLFFKEERVNIGGHLGSKKSLQNRQHEREGGRKRNAIKDEFCGFDFRKTTASKTKHWGKIGQTQATSIKAKKRGRSRRIYLGRNRGGKRKPNRNLKKQLSI